MAFQVDVTQKKNGTFLVGARLLTEVNAPAAQLRANPYKDVSTFLHVLHAAQYEAATRAAIEEAVAQAESLPETQVTCEVPALERQQLAKIGLN